MTFNSGAQNDKKRIRKILLVQFIKLNSIMTQLLQNYINKSYLLGLYKLKQNIILIGLIGIFSVLQYN